MATSALGVVSFDLIKHELRLPLADTSQDGLLEFQIDAAISWMEKELSVPILDKYGALGAARPRRSSGYLFGQELSAEDAPLCFRTQSIRSVTRVRYWSCDNGALRENADETIAIADLGRSGYGADGIYRIWPPDDGWPEILSGSLMLADVVVGIDPTPPGLRQAVILAVRQLYEGHDEIRPNHAMYALMNPFRRYTLAPDEAVGVFSNVVPPTQTETPLTPSVPPVTPGQNTHYVAISTDNVFTSAEFTGALTGGSSVSRRLRIPAYSGSSRYIGFAVPDSEPDIVAIETGGFDVTNAFERVTGTITIQSVLYKVWRSRVIQNDRASGVLYSITQ